MSDCLFCKICAGAIPSETILEDEYVRAFKDINPKAPVHILVVPKEHIESIAHLEEKGHESVIAHVIFTAKKIAADEGLTGYKLIFNVGRDGGQIVDHLHLHLLGGWKEKSEGGSLIS